MADRNREKGWTRGGAYEIKCILKMNEKRYTMRQEP